MTRFISRSTFEVATRSSQPRTGRRRAYMLAMSRLTRSSTARNGSLHSTVRCAWSLSLRCTQSTVKSRPAACAALMNSPRSRARVVCGGVSTASAISSSVVIARRQTLALQQVEDTPTALDVVVGQVQLGDLRVGQLHVVAVLVALEQLALDHPVDLGVDLGEVLALDGVELAAPQVDDLLDLRVGLPGLQVLDGARSSTPAGCPARWPDARRPAAPGGGR